MEARRHAVHCSCVCQLIPAVFVVLSHSYACNDAGLQTVEDSQSFEDEEAKNGGQKQGRSGEEFANRDCQGDGRGGWSPDLRC